MFHLSLLVQDFYLSVDLSALGMPDFSNQIKLCQFILRNQMQRTFGKPLSYYPPTNQKEN